MQGPERRQYGTHNNSNRLDPVPGQGRTGKKAQRPYHGPAVSRVSWGREKSRIQDHPFQRPHIACLSKEDVRRYLYEQAVAAAVHLSGFTRNPSHPFLPGEIKEDGRGTLYAYVTCQGLDDLGDLARDAGGGRKFSFTAKPWGYDSMRFPAGRLTADIRKFMEEEPGLPVIISTGGHGG